MPSSFAAEVNLRDGCSLEWRKYPDILDQVQ